MITAAAVALVLARRPVLDDPPAAAAHRARPQLCVERLDGLRLQATQRQSAEDRSDVVADVALVRDPRRRLDVEDRQVPVQHLVGGGAGARVAALVNLGEQPRPGLLRLLGRPRSGRDGLVEVVACEPLTWVGRPGIEPGTRGLKGPSN